MSLSYNRTGDTIEIIERDSTMKKLGSWKINVADRKLLNNVFGYLKQKYNITFPTIRPEESVNEKKKDWIDMDVKL